MLYENEVRTFCSQPSDSSKPTSKYFVCKNGTVRAKVAAGEIYATPFNICYVDQAARNHFGKGYKGASVTYSAQDSEVTMVWEHKDDSSKTVTVVGKVSPDTTHNRVYEFECDDDGDITHRHMGSLMTSDFDGKSSGYSEDDVDDACAGLMNSEQNKITRFGKKSL